MRHYLPAGLLVLAAALVHGSILGAPWYGTDDAYIVAHNARVLLQGHDANYGDVSALVGTTSSIHLALVTLLSVPLPGPWALEVAGWIATLAFVLGVVHLCRNLRVPTPGTTGIVAAALVAGVVPHQLTNGLETGLVLAALTWALALLVSGGGPWLAALCGTLPFIRPDLVPASFGIVVAGFLGRVLRPRDLVFAALAAAPWALWLWLELGTPYPMTAGAKRYFFAEAGLPGWLKTQWVLDALFDFVAPFGILCVGWALLFLTNRRVALAFLIFAPALVLAYWLEFPGGLGHYERRYLYPLVPFLLVGVAASLVAVRTAVRVAGGVTLAVGLVLSLAALPTRWEDHLALRRFGREQLAGVAEWMNANLPPGSRLLVHDAGYVAWGTDFHLVDIVGLKTPAAVPLHRDVTFPGVGHGRAEAIHRLALAEQPDYVVVLSGWESIYGIAAGLRDNGWGVEPLSDKRFTYRVYRLSPPTVSPPRVTVSDG